MAFYSNIINNKRMLTHVGFNLKYGFHRWSLFKHNIDLSYSQQFTGIYCVRLRELTYHTHTHENNHFFFHFSKKRICWNDKFMGPAM